MFPSDGGTRLEVDGGGRAKRTDGQWWGRMARTADGGGGAGWCGAEARLKATGMEGADHGWWQRDRMARTAGG